MSKPWYLEPAAWSYGVAAFAFCVFAIQLFVGRRGHGRATLLLVAVVFSVAWAAAAAAFSLLGDSLSWRAAHVLDAVRLGAVLGFVVSVATRSAAAGADGRVERSAGIQYAALAALTALTVFFAEPPPVPLPGHGAATSLAFGVLLLRSVVGLALVEQLYRGTQPAWRWNIRPLCLGLGGALIYDLVLFSDALLYRGMDPYLWAGRGFVNALVIPLLGLAAARNREWNLAVTVSRSLITGSTALMASGAYLLAIAVAGYYVRYFGGTWGRALQIVLTFAALLLFGLVALSGTFRSKLRVFVGKHLLPYRYDYREEWLKFTRVLSEATFSTAPVLSIQALAELVESPAGALWLKQEEAAYAPAANFNMASATAVEPTDGSLAAFLGRTGWVIDLDELRAKPSAYAGFMPPDWLQALPNAWLVIPLPVGETLAGFVVLARPRVRVDLNWEVLDLLKTAGRQAASYLTMLQTSEALLEARKFDAFNRMSAFVVHDLKNLVAQLQLLLKNAERHRDNPDFQRDMLGTIQHVVGRMNQLMAQLRAGGTPIESPQPVDLSTVVRRALAVRAADRVELDLDLGVTVRGHPERLERVVGHLVQNAFDAVGDNPRVRVRVFREGEEGVVEVGDNGVGMTPEFVRERLFRPFQTTKKMGMGIGAYESQQYVSALGGRITVDSAVGRGTTVRVRLPLAQGEQAVAALRREAA
ncbi:MAG TPA: XrtA/PEP-CTERM system histidine kinase PrsK [Burkholderiaceae bacterium]|nr:XrtA/PEP-CTERM system histidine kinase PrsK [Burkholderiaceae bacterium]